MGFYLNSLFVYFSYKFIWIFKDYINPVKLITYYNFKNESVLPKIKKDTFIDKKIMILSKKPEKTKSKFDIKTSINTSTCDDFEKIDSNEKLCKDVFEINLEQIINNSIEYIIVNLTEFSIYELKYIHSTLLFFIPFDRFIEIKKSNYIIIIKVKDNTLYSI